MAVMNNMREYTKVILIILVLAFVGTIIFDWGMQFTGLKTRKGVIGKVDGVEISAVQYDQAFTRELQRYREQTGGDVPDTRMDFLRDQVWESLVRDILLQKALKKYGIRAADDEILYTLHNAPPAILQSNPSFQNEKKQFDMAKYQAALNDPNTAPQWRPVEEYLRQSLPYEKFQQRLMASVRVTEDEIKQEYLRKNQTAAVKYVFINPRSFDVQDADFSDDVLRAYYNAHKDEFKEPEMRKINYVTFSTVATAADSAKIYEQAEKLLRRLKEGEDFAELAQIYSDDPGSKDKGGDLGFFKKGTMVKPFEEAAFSAKLGQIVGPIKSSFGLHIIKVEEKRIEKGEEEVKARHILLKFNPSSKTLNQARDDADYFASEAKSRPFEEVAEELHVAVNTSTFFAKKSGFVPGLGMDKRVSDFVFSHGVGSVGAVKETPDGYFVYQVADIQKEHIKPFEEAKQTILMKVKSEKQMELAAQKADAVYQKVRSGNSLENVAKEDSLELKKVAPFTRDGYVPGIGRDANFIGTAFALENPGDVSKPVKGLRGYYVLELLEKSAFDETDFKQKREQLKAQLLRQKQSQVFNSWYAVVRDKADIEDYRAQYYQ